jgi:alpha-L-fucosidase
MGSGNRKLVALVMGGAALVAVDAAGTARRTEGGQQQEEKKATTVQEQREKQKPAAATEKAEGKSAKIAGPVETTKYVATSESLRKHPLPEWYEDAKLGIFIHWGLYSVPGWAVPTPEGVRLPEEEYLKNNPYAEWYLNTLRLDGSPTQKYHKQNYGANYDYYNFADTFNREIKRWNPDAWARVFELTGAKYVVLTTKHHDGFALWPSEIPNPTLPENRQHASRDLVGELKAAVEKRGMRMGVYYSGGYDWTFVPGPIRNWKQAKSVEPQSEEYGKYADAQMRELIEKYKPAVLWNDIDYPRSGHPLEIIAEYYNTVPDGVVNDRFGLDFADFTSPEYETLADISEKKWEECRGLGRSFGYNRVEGERETIKKDELIYLLVDIVSKNGNLLLDVGPEADGTIPGVQFERLQALGKWMDINKEAIYGTRPWNRAEGETRDELPVRFTQKGGAVYAVLLGEPKGQAVVIKGIRAKGGAKVTLLGLGGSLDWKQVEEDLEVQLPAGLPGNYAYTVKMVGVE